MAIFAFVSPFTTSLRWFIVIAIARIGESEPASQPAVVAIEVICLPLVVDRLRAGVM